MLLLIFFYVLFFMYFTVTIQQIQELLKGQKTKVFQDNPIPEYEVRITLSSMHRLSVLLDRYSRSKQDMSFHSLSAPSILFFVLCIIVYLQASLC